MEPHEKMEYELAADSMKKALPPLLGSYPAIAAALKSYYDELVKAGFNEAQALFIVSNQGISARLGGDNK